MSILQKYCNILLWQDGQVMASMSPGPLCLCALQYFRVTVRITLMRTDDAKDATVPLSESHGFPPNHDLSYWQGCRAPWNGARQEADWAAAKSLRAWTRHWDRGAERWLTMCLVARRGPGLEGMLGRNNALKSANALAKQASALQIQSFTS